MDKRLGFAMVLSASALAWIGCDGERPPEDAGCGPGTGVICLGDAGSDAATSDSGPMVDSGPPSECPLTAGREIGAPCSRNTCTSPLVCDEQAMGGIPTVLPDLTTAGPTINLTFNPGGGVCTAACESDEDCGDCALCTQYTAGGQCEYACTPTLDDNGGCRTGYSCNLGGGTCQLGCATDEFCKITGTHDANGDGTPDAYIFDPAYPATCDLNTGRCEVMGTAGAEPGDACEDDTDCEDNGLCITGDGWGAGYCARIGCGYEGFDCADGASCDVRNLGTNICMQGCAVGAETDAQALGADDGQAAGCQLGHMCSWSGTAGPTDDPNGSCIPGNYNDVTVPNVGGACQTAEDCYSPYGGGRCLWGTDESEGLRMTGDRVGSGMCVVQNCAQFMEGTEIVDGLLPGVNTTTSVCDYAGGERCVNFGSMEEPFNLCITTCTTGDECAPGYGCIQFFSGSGPGTRACWPACDQNAGDTAYAGCHTGATCEHATTGAPCDADGADNTPNTADDQQCFCSDAGPRPTPDAGPGDEDAGTTADAGPMGDGGPDAGPAPTP